MSARHAKIRPRRDPFIEVLSEMIQLEKRSTTWKELASRTYVSPASFSRYGKARGRFIRSDTLRGILQACGYDIKVVK